MSLLFAAKNVFPKHGNAEIIFVFWIHYILLSIGLPIFFINYKDHKIKKLLSKTKIKVTTIKDQKNYSSH